MFTTSKENGKRIYRQKKTNNIREFDRAAFKECDPKAKNKLIQHLKSDIDNHRVNVVENPNRFDVDIIQTVYGYTIYHEVEVKRVWVGDWPVRWKTVDIPYRKAKFLHYRPIFFWLICNDYEKAWKVRGCLLRNRKPIKKLCENRYMGKFFMIPVGYCDLIILE